MHQPSLKQRKLSDLDRQIRERRKYLKDQEALVEDTVASLNIRLREFDHELQIAQERKITLLREVERLETNVCMLQAKLEVLETTYQSKVAEYREKLTQMQ